MLKFVAEGAASVIRAKCLEGEDEMESSIRVIVEADDATRYRTDVLVLKHAQNLYGVDAAVYEELGGNEAILKLPAVGEHLIAISRRGTGAERVLFVGVKPLRNFGYSEIRDFSRRAMSILAADSQKIRRVVFTIHGPGYGLDEIECFESELAGIVEAISQDDYPEHLEQIAFVERDVSRARRLSVVLSRLLPGGKLSRGGRGHLAGLDNPAKQALRTAGYGSAAKPRVFVAMPFADSMNDVFHYGIQGAINSAGLLAERADLSAFTGDVMEWVRARISGANLVVADLTDSNSNVYLEVGFAWGKGVPTVLLAKSSADLKFDVRGQRCILYSSIKELEQKLSKELADIMKPSG